MNPVFGSFAVDFVFALTLGALGGVAAELITNKGNIETWHRSDKKFLFDLGIASNLMLGAVVALAYLFILETSDPYKFVGAMVGAGVGGSAVLTAIKQKLVSTITEEELENQQIIVENAANNVEKVRQELDDLQTKLVTRESGGAPKTAALQNLDTTLSRLKSTIVFTETSLKDSVKAHKSKKHQ